MKKLSIILSAIAVIAMLFSSCGKYEEGPSFSLATKKARLKGTWELTETKVNGEVIDLADIIGSIGSEVGDSIINLVDQDLGILAATNAITIVTFDKNGNGSFDFSMSILSVLNGDIEWDFANSKEDLNIKLIPKGGAMLEYLQSEEGLGTDIGSIIDIISLIKFQFPILRLTKKDLWLKYDDTLTGSDSRVELKFAKK
ncbi:MAG: hypothetical protein LBQ22_06505 [Bacteroidales bacterium]|jgi:hypothetical protein|nr:hypothetical protein [Bacteroidales bacterium]